MGVLSTRTLSQSKRLTQVPFTGVSRLEPLPGPALAGNLYATQLFFACHFVAITRVALLPTEAPF